MTPFDVAPRLNPLVEAFPATAGKLPWLSLATLPTPVEELALAAGVPGRLFVKRDDLTSALYGGNKIRKFEYLLAEAQRRGARTLVTMGGIGSNQGLAAALHGRALGCRVELSLAWQPVTDEVRRALRGMIAAGARIHYSAGTIAAWRKAVRLVRALRRSGGAPFPIPIGATSALGSLGYVAAALELAGQIRAGLLPEPDRIFVAAGTCGTAAGLVVGCRLAGLRTQVIAVRIAERLYTNRVLLLWEARRVAAVLGTLGCGIPPIRIAWRDVTLLGGFAGPGYGAPTREAQAAIDWAAPRLSLDSTYTGKALAACLDWCRTARDRGTVVFWNTFNSAPFALADRFDGLPAPLTAVLERTAGLAGPTVLP